MVPSPAHDHVVLTRSLAAAMTTAGSRRRDRALTMRAPPPLRMRRPAIARRPRPPEGSPSVSMLETGPIREAAAAQQQDAIDTRARARDLLAANDAIRARLEDLDRRISTLAALRRR
jgi:hypothetical protein